MCFFFYENSFKKMKIKKNQKKNKTKEKEEIDFQPKFGIKQIVNQKRIKNNKEKEKL